MLKDFDKWNTKKKDLDQHEIRRFFKEGEIWWIHLGLNIGYETNGKGCDLIRPVLILKKYNNFSFLAGPLTTSVKPNKYKLFVGLIGKRHSSIILSQLRNIDSKRLINKIIEIDKELLLEIKRKASQVNLD